MRNHPLPQQKMKACRKWLIKDVHHLCFPGGIWRCWIHTSVTRLPAGIAASISHVKIVILLSPLQTDISFQYVVPSSSLFRSYLIWWHLQNFLALILILPPFTKVWLWLRHCPNHSKSQPLINKLKVGHNGFRNKWLTKINLHSNTSVPVLCKQVNHKSSEHHYIMSLYYSRDQRKETTFWISWCCFW